jgi:hypothetical protein
MPFFAYGSFQPGQLAFNQVAGLVASAPDARLDDYHLVLRDGLPLLVEGGGGVQGALLTFRDNQTGDGYSRIGAFEPAEQYMWHAVTIGHELAWACLGRRPQAGTAHAEETNTWSSADDPSLVFGIPTVARLAREYMSVGDEIGVGSGAKRSDDPNWTGFFGLQSAYLLLWSIVERIATFRYGAVGGPNSRVDNLGKDELVMRVVLDLGVPTNSIYRPLYDTRFPKKPVKIAPNGAKALKYWYQVRNNVAHRGKAGMTDWQLLEDSLTDLHEVIMRVLREWLPELADAWGDRVSPPATSSLKVAPPKLAPLSGS